MKEGILVIKVGQEFFAIRVKEVKAIIGISKENFKESSLLSSHVLGLVEYHNNVYPLIDPNVVLNSKKFDVESLLKNKKGIAVIVQRNQKAYAIPVDEIVTIEIAKRVNIEGGESSVFAVKNGFVEEFSFEKLEELEIPYLNLNDEAKEVRSSRKKSYYIVVDVGRKKFCIDAKLVRKVVEVKFTFSTHISDKGWVNKAYSVDGKVIKGGNLKKLLGISSEDECKYLVILEREGKYFALLVDGVDDIIEISNQQVTKSFGKDSVLDKFVNVNEKVFPFISTTFLERVLDKEATHLLEKKEERRISAKGNNYLVVRVGNVRFGVELGKVKKLVRSENVSVNSYGSLGGIIQVNKEIYPMINIAEELQSDEKVDVRRADYLLLDIGEKSVAIPISQVEGITRASAGKEVSSPKNRLFSKSVVDEKGEVLNIINTDRLVEEVYGT